MQGNKIKVVNILFMVVFITINGYGQNERDYEIQANDGGITILRYKGTQKEVEIPSTILGSPVTMIYNKAFYMKQLSKVVIPEGVFYIGPEAFKSNRLTEVTIPNTVTFLGNGVFALNQLTKVSISNGIKYIPNSAFANNKLEDVEIPGSVIVIGVLAFSNNKVANIRIPENVIYIDSRAFESNPIKQIVLSENVKYIGNGAFDFITTTAGITNMTIQIGSYVEISKVNDVGSYKRAFPFYFEKYYSDNGSQGGEYTYNSNSWSYR
jgi:hypothetical protein